MPTNDSIKIRELTPAELAERAATCQRTCENPGLKEATMEVLKSAGYLHWHIWINPQWYPEFIPVVLELFHSADPNDWERRLQLAGYLARLGVPAGQDFIVAQLQNPDSQVRWRALLAWDIEKCPPRNPAEIESLVSLLQDADLRVRDQALGYCCSVAREQAAPLIEKILSDAHTHHPRRGWMFFWLCAYAGIENRFDAAVEFLRHSATADDTEWAVRTLCEAVKMDLPDVSARARSVLEDFYVNSPNRFKYAQNIVRSFVEIATASTLPALQSIAEQAADSTSQSYALEAIAGQNPPLALKLIRSHVKRHYLNSSFLRLFGVAATEADWDALVTIVLDEIVAKPEAPAITNRAVDVLLDHGRERGRALIEKEMPRLWPPVRMHALWKLNRWKIQDVLRDMRDRGLIDSLPDPSLIETIRSERNFPAADSEIFHEVLREAGILRDVPSESDISALNHCHLLAEFSQITDGVFRPQYCRQVLLKRPVEDPGFRESLNQQRAAESLHLLPTEEEFYQAGFVSGNLLFEFETFHSESNYAVSTVRDAVEAALERTPQPKRLIQAYSEDCFEFFFWGNPGPIRDFCRAYAIPLLSDFKSS